MFCIKDYNSLLSYKDLAQGQTKTNVPSHSLTHVHAICRATFVKNSWKESSSICATTKVGNISQK